ncbi:MAG TPA: thioredoxin-like domain-containing protein [Chitinophagaceae bacterium]|nr:thioredoxin-like domain-containing protein [Chitinophagaceae bacterium]
MKRIVFLPLFFISASLIAQQEGYEIKVSFKPFANQYIYLGHYEGKQLPIIDSVLVNDKSEGTFRGATKLGGGVYLIGYPNKQGFFEFLIGKEQHFSIKADTSDLGKISFTNSQDNDLFLTYQKFMSENGRRIDSAQKLYPSAETKKDSAALLELIVKTNKAIRDYRFGIMKKYPDATLSFLLTLLQEPEVPPASQQPGGKYDSTYAWQYYKTHFWDGINFYDDRLIRTPIFENKLDKYFDQVVYPHPDSVIKEIDWMVGYASTVEENQKFLLMKFVNRYLNMKYMWEDAVFVHLYEKYFAQKTYSWLTEKGMKTIQDRAYSLMSNILGNPASDIDLPDTSGKHRTLYGQTSAYTVVVIWDPTCGHCKEIVPKVDSLYEQKWKAEGVRIYAMAKETDGTKNDWMNFIRQHHLQDWTNVYYSKADEKARVDAGVPGYSQLYDVLSFPTLYLLDKDKRIVAKKLSFDQINEVLQQKINRQ